MFEGKQPYGKFADFLTAMRPSAQAERAVQRSNRAPKAVIEWRK
jgi:hypothetical protein